MRKVLFGVMLATSILGSGCAATATDPSGTSGSDSPSDAAQEPKSEGDSRPSLDTSDVSVPACVTNGTMDDLVEFVVGDQGAATGPTTEIPRWLRTCGGKHEQMKAHYSATMKFTDRGSDEPRTPTQWLDFGYAACDAFASTSFLTVYEAAANLTNGSTPLVQSVPGSNYPNDAIAIQFAASMLCADPYAYDVVPGVLKTIDSTMTPEESDKNRAVIDRLLETEDYASYVESEN